MHYNSAWWQVTVGVLLDCSISGIRSRRLFTFLDHHYPIVLKYFFMLPMRKLNPQRDPSARPIKVGLFLAKDLEWRLRPWQICQRNGASWNTSAPQCCFSTRIYAWFISTLRARSYWKRVPDISLAIMPTTSGPMPKNSPPRLPARFAADTHTPSVRSDCRWPAKKRLR